MEVFPELAKAGNTVLGSAAGGERHLIFSVAIPLPNDPNYDFWPQKELFAQPEKWPYSWVSQSGQQDQEILQKFSSHLSHSPAEGQGVRMRTQRACQMRALNFI